jgi:hypothetical protein
MIMKNLVALILCFCGLNAGAQNTREIKVYDREGKFVECRLIVNTEKPTKLFLIKSVQKRDNPGNYITQIYIGNKDTLPVTPVEIMFKFSAAVINITPSYAQAFNAVIAISDDHTGYLFKAARLNRDSGSVIAVSLIIKSKERITIEIKGLDGELK